MESYGADAIELNLSCPHVKGFGSEVGSDPDLVEEIVTEVKAKVSVPVFAKLTPNVALYSKRSIVSRDSYLS